MSPFDKAPEFIEWDNRRVRRINPVSKEQMHNKHDVLFPAAIVRGASVLDLGCALGSTGHWCLSMGAISYKGVEAQETYANQAKQLLDKYHPGKASIDVSSIETFLSAADEQYDIVTLLGVLYVFTDYYSILKKSCSLAKKYVVIESQYPYGPRFKNDFVGVEFKTDQDINLADENASLKGRGTRISPAGLAFLMQDFGFESDEGQLYPKPIPGVDVYNDMTTLGPRYLLRFTRKHAGLENLSQDLEHEQRGPKKPWQPIYE